MNICFTETEVVVLLQVHSLPVYSCCVSRNENISDLTSFESWLLNFIFSKIKERVNLGL
jgi:hypothetical protein